MSKHDEPTYLRHMRDYATEARLFAQGRSRSDLETDRMFMLATTRLLEMMGEAATQVSAATRIQNHQIPWPSIIGLRHRLVHAYDQINLDIIWDILTNDLPPMIAALDAMLGPPAGPLTPSRDLDGEGAPSPDLGSPGGAGSYSLLKSPRGT
jgi:uncharacterized protein with HEPN domain